VFRRKHLSRIPEVKTGFWVNRSCRCEYGKKPALPLTMTLIPQHF